MRSTITIPICYLLLAVTLVSIALKFGNWCYLLIYPACSFAIVAIGYLGAGPVVFGKRFDGRRYWPAKILLGPYLLLANGIWLLARHFTNESPIDELYEGLLLSRRLLAKEIPPTVNSVIDLTCELSDPTARWPIDCYLCFPILDAAGADPEKLIELTEEIQEMPEPVLIHCAQGHGRTGMVAAALLIVSGQADSAQEAVTIVKAVRPGIELSPAQFRTLEAIEERCVTIRFDGIYSDFDGAMYRHLRFFENGKVAFLLIALDPYQVAQGLNEAFHEKCGGMFQLNAKQVSFVITDRGFGNREDVVVEYRGEVRRHYLTLDIYSRTTLHRSIRVFRFYPIETPTK